MMDTQTAEKLPVAELALAAVYLVCPCCGCTGAVANKSNGSVMQTYEEWMALEWIVTCAECGADFRLPPHPFRA